MIECPNCRMKTIRKIEKFMMGPARTLLCSNCGSKLSISWWSLAVFILHIVGALVIGEMLELKYYSFRVLIGIVLFSYVQYKYIRVLVKLKSDNHILIEE